VASAPRSAQLLLLAAALLVIYALFLSPAGDLVAPSIAGALAVACTGAGIWQFARRRSNS
jgi:hypothetical protein